MKHYLFGMPYDDTDVSQTVAAILSHASAGNQTLVVTPNVDHFLRWQKSPRFRELYDKAGIGVLDGTPLVWLARLLGQPAGRLTGVDLTLAVLPSLEELEGSFALVGGQDEIQTAAVHKIRARHPGLRNVWGVSPSSADLASGEYVDGLARELKALSGPLVVALCLGSPKQEELFGVLADRLVRGTFLGVGATVDFMAGRKIRAPKAVQALGLEWLFRLIQEPRRLWRRYLVDGRQIFGYFARAFGYRISGSK